MIIYLDVLYRKRIIFGPHHQFKPSYREFVIEGTISKFIDRSIEREGERAGKGTQCKQFSCYRTISEFATSAPSHHDRFSRAWACYAGPQVHQLSSSMSSSPWMWSRRLTQIPLWTGRHIFIRFLLSFFSWEDLRQANCQRRRYIKVCLARVCMHARLSGERMKETDITCLAYYYRYKFHTPRSQQHGMGMVRGSGLMIITTRGVIVSWS